MRSKFLLLKLLGIAIIIMFSSVVLAETQQQPVGPDTLTEMYSGRHPVSSPLTHNAYAGNVTGLELYTRTSTLGWQGYFGNVSGTITLDDASNNTMYDWALAAPEGEVYAATATVSNWDNVLCAGAYNISYHENETYNFNKYPNGTLKTIQDVDGIDETFNVSFAGDFYVGSQHISSASGCQASYLYVSDAADPTGKFTELLLLDNSTANGVLIFTSLLVQGGTTGFDSVTHDFQMLVAEDGHNGNEATTAYYFYVEIQ